MATKKPVPTRPQSVAEQARAIYNRHVQMVQDGLHDSSMSFRQAVLEEYRSTFDTTEGALATYYVNSQRSAGVKVNSEFEIERVAGSPSSFTGKTKAGVSSSSKVLKKVPKQGPGASAVSLVSKTPPAKATTVPSPRVTLPVAKAVTAPSPIVSSPAAKPTPKQRAEKVHADLIALCKDEIAEAFGTLEELLDNVDQLGDAKTLKTFTRQVRSACKKIESQIQTKAIIDKQQAYKILPKL